MTQYFSFIFIVALLSFTSSVAIANTDKPIKVVTSFSILENLVSELGGEHVHIVNLVGRGDDSHMYQPQPSDTVAVAKADLVITNGLGFEGWISRLIESSDFKKHHLVASNGSDILLGDSHEHHKNDHEDKHHKKHQDNHQNHDDHEKDHKDEHHDSHEKGSEDNSHAHHEDEHNNDLVKDPHAWHSLSNIKIYIKNITQELIEIKPNLREYFMNRNQVLLSKIESLESNLKQQINSIPVKDRIVVTSHDSLAYLGREFSIQFLAPVGLSTEDEPSAKDVAELIDLIREKKIKALFLDSINNPKMLKRISEETGVSIGGHLFSDALGNEDSQVNSYLGMMQHNVESITKALSKK